MIYQHPPRTVQHHRLMAELDISEDELNPAYRKEVQMFADLHKGLELLNPEDPADKKAIKRINQLLNTADVDISNDLLNLVDVLRGEEHEAFINETKQVTQKGAPPHPDAAVLEKLFKAGKTKKLTASFLRNQGIKTPLRAKEVVYRNYLLKRTSATRFIYKLLKR